MRSHYMTNILRNHKRFLYSFFTILLIACNFPVQKTTASESSAPILIISSYNPDTQFTTSTIISFNDTYRHLGGKSPISIENMNCQSLSESQTWEKRLKNILLKHKQLPPKLIILIGQEAWASYLSQDTLPFKNTPVLCSMASRNVVLLPDNNQDIKLWNPESIDVFKDMPNRNIKAGFAYEYDIKKNIELIMNLYPLTRNIAFISDNTYEGISLQALVKKEFKNFPDLNLILLDGRLKTIYSIIEDIKNLPPNTVILFGTWKVDASNAFFIKNAIYTMSGVNPKVPVFSIISFGLNNWVLGGYSPNYRQQGPDMAKQAINIEKGEEANIKFIPNEYIFDFNKIKESDIPIEKLPRNSILLNKTLPLWKEYPVEFISIISVLIILVIALCCTLFFYFRTKKVKEHLEMSEKELIIAKDRAEESNRLKSAFLANMSHEIRTPLNAIVGFSTVLAEENKNKEQQEYLDIIQKNSDLLLRLINDILDLSRLESGRVQFNFSLCDITQLCRDQIAIINRVKKNAIAYIFEADEPLSMVTDPQRLQQIFINLLNNAGKFTDTGTITLSYNIEPNKNRVIFSVSDTGCGIPKEKQRQVFERFEKLNEFAQGSGLGLSICKLTINNMGGDIWIDPDYTKGSRFCFSHPLNLKIPPEKKHHFI